MMTAATHRTTEASLTPAASNCLWGECMQLQNNERMAHATRPNRTIWKDQTMGDKGERMRRRQIKQIKGSRDIT
jgi:hypothetical protein